MVEADHHDDPTEHTTRLLKRASAGDAAAAEELLPLVYNELRARAGAYFRGQPLNHTLQPTALVHEAYVKLVNSSANEWQDRAHFCAVASRAMRQILTNHARRRVLAENDRANRAQTLMQSPSSNTSIDVLALDNALTKLGERNADSVRLVELRFYGGLTVSEAADVLSVSESTVEREWRRVRAWLLAELRDEDSILTPPERHQHMMELLDKLCGLPRPNRIHHIAVWP